MTTQPTANLPRTLRDLRKSGWQSKPVKAELRDNMVAALRRGDELFPGIVGYENTVIPEIVNAILAGHARVAAGLKIPVPMCVLLSARTAVPSRWSDELTSADTVLVVDDIARAALKLGPSVTVERIDGALHDVFLSRHDAREIAYHRLDRWVTGFVAARHPSQ